MISVIIPTLNEEKYISRCLESLADQSFEEKFEVIIIDNNSQDKTREVIEKNFQKFSGKFSGKIFISKAKGIGKVRKFGAEKSQGDILAFTDADTTLNERWLERINENLKKYDLSTGPVFYYENNLKVDLIKLWRKIYRIFHLFDFYWMIGSNMAIKKEIYQELGGHKDFSILDDFDISFRAYKTNQISGKYDKKQKVYTSARRLSNLFGYFLTFLYGHYNYHFTKDYDKLVNYPKLDKMDLESILKIISENHNKNS
jgi:glycosyltransferase involved in cell wall biosynthesis